MTQQQIKQIEELTGFKVGYHSDSYIKFENSYIKFENGKNYFIIIFHSKEMAFQGRFKDDDYFLVPHKGLIEIPKIMGWV